MKDIGLLNQHELSYELFPVIIRVLLAGSKAEMLYTQYTQYSDVDKILEYGPKIVEVNNPSQSDDTLFNSNTTNKFHMNHCRKNPGFAIRKLE